MFVEHGYLETTVAAIAAEAGVVVQTLYLSFGSKVAILRAAHDVAVVGDDTPVPVLQRPWVAELSAEPNGRRALRLVIDNGLQIIERATSIMGVIQSAAADADVADLLQDVERATPHHTTSVRPRARRQERLQPISHTARSS